MLDEQQVQRGLRNVILDGVMSHSMATLTGGAFLAAFALQLGATNITIGLLAAISPIAQLIQIPGILLVERVRKRRAITVVTASLSRVFLLLIAAIPFLFSMENGLFYLILALALNSVFAAVTACSWNSWMGDLIPQDIRGSFLSKRMSIAFSVGIFLSIFAAFGIDYLNKNFPLFVMNGYSLLFAAGFLLGIIGVFVIARIPEPPMPRLQEKPRIIPLLLEPFKDPNYRNLILFLGSWNFAVNLAAPFFTVYMLKRLEFDLSWIIGFTVLSQFMNVIFLRIWGRFTDRFSNKSVLRVCGPLFILCILAWTFTTMPEPYVMTLPLLVLIHIFMGIAAAGVTIGTGNIGIKLAPQGKATAYLGANSVINSLSAFIGPILGGLFADFFAARELSLTVKWFGPEREIVFQTLNFQQWDFFFFFAFLVGLYSIHRLASVREIGEVEEKIVIHEFVEEVERGLRSISSVPGIRHMIQFPFFVLSKIAPEKNRKKESGNK